MTALPAKDEFQKLDPDMHGERRTIEPAEYAALSRNTYTDVLIIGGGPSGLSAALGLAHRRCTTVVFDTRKYSIGDRHQVQNLVTWDNSDFEAFHSTALYDSLGRYETNLYINALIIKARKTARDSFELVDVFGNVWKGRKLIIASGVDYTFPRIDGFTECWAKGIFPTVSWIPPRTGSEVSSGVLTLENETNTDGPLEAARDALLFTSTVRIYTNGNKDLAKKLTRVMRIPNHHFDIEARNIKNLRMTGRGSEVAVMLDNPPEIRVESFLTRFPNGRLRGPFASQLNLNTIERTVNLTLQINVQQQTSLKGVFAAGDCAGNLTPNIPAALYSGGQAALCASRQIQTDKFGHLVSS